MKRLGVLILLILISTVSLASAETRGTMISVTGGSTATFTWSAENFGGFYYDLNKDITSETLEITVEDRTIPVSGLVYTVTAVPVEYPVHKQLGLEVNGKANYSVVGFQGSKYVAMNGKANKLAKLIYEMDETDKVTLTAGSVLQLGGGYTLKILGIDKSTSPKQVSLAFSKEGIELDSGISETKQLYTYSAKILGETDVTSFSVFVDSIFAGSVDSVQLKYVWLIDTSNAREIKSASTYGVFKATSTGTSSFVLKNDDEIGLSPDTEIVLLENLKFRVADDSSTLRFYPFIEDIVVTQNTTAGTIVRVTPTIAPTPVITPIYDQNGTILNNVTPVGTPVPRATSKMLVETTPTVTVTQPPTPKPTAEPPVGAIFNGTGWEVPKKKLLPGFEAGFAIIGLIVVAFFVKRNQKKE